MVKPLPVAHFHDFALEIFHSGVGAAVLAALQRVGWSVHVGQKRDFVNPQGVDAVSYTHLLMLGVQMMFSFMLTDSENPIKRCRHCTKAFVASRPSAVFCSPQCKNLSLIHI